MKEKQKVEAIIIKLYKSRGEKSLSSKDKKDSNTRNYTNPDQAQHKY